MIAHFNFCYLCVTGLRESVYSYEVMKNCDLYGRAYLSRDESEQRGSSEELRRKRKFLLEICTLFQS